MSRFNDNWDETPNTEPAKFSAKPLPPPPGGYVMPKQPRFKRATMAIKRHSRWASVVTLLTVSLVTIQQYLSLRGEVREKVKTTAAVSEKETGLLDNRFDEFLKQYKKERRWLWKRLDSITESLPRKWRPQATEERPKPEELSQEE